MEKSEQTMWSEFHYGTYRFSAAGFRGSVRWDHGQWIGMFEGWKLVRRFNSAEEAKLAVEELAKRKAAELLSLL